MMKLQLMPFALIILKYCLLNIMYRENIIGIVIKNSLNFKDKQDQGFRYKEEELYEAFYRPINLHFTGYVKPWNKEKIPFKEYWWYYANKTKYMKEIMDAYEFSDLQIKEILSKLNETNTITIKLNVTYILIFFIRANVEVWSAI